MTRGPNLKNLLPQILFSGDEDEVLANTLAAMGDEYDEIKTFISQIANVKRISYDKFNDILPLELVFKAIPPWALVKFTAAVAPAAFNNISPLELVFKDIPP